MKRFLDGRMEGEKESVVLSVKEKQIGRTLTLRNERRSCLERCSPLHNQNGVKQRKKEGRKF